ncbi:MULTISPECIES: hypothetical protein [Mycolicibacter]|uniref:Uncharacterized protein n=2 Tax=Mycolicibacter TaxID=1073531 RepID=A0ABU5XM40_9MYCO|nr:MULTISPECIES: hypothetical protein [unclassified Mycolicibacter]MEB3023348.1 hypothetical protein [Mycolicibacter sp. MYC098]MEB3033690.1 hypothetical protein [Mycolicibacter sp. MYC340]
MSEIEKLIEGIALPTIELRAASLFYKFGFDDGDLIRRWVENVYDISGYRIWLSDALLEVARITDALQRRLWSPDWHAALWELVRTRLLPLVPGRFDLQLLLNDCSHDPIRCHGWNGRTYSTGDAAPTELAESASLWTAPRSWKH